MKKIIFLVSGNGGNMKFIDACIKKNIIKNIELIVIGDRECGAINYAVKKNIENYIIQYTRDNNAKLIQLLSKLEPDLIITTWNKILDKKIVQTYYDKLINLHYSLLPSFAGMIGVKPILESIKKKCKFVGATVHYVNENVDDGEIISQSITRNNTNEIEIIDRVFKMGCLMLLNTFIIKNPELLNNKYEFSEISNSGFNNCIFEPELKFSTIAFDDNFWENLRSET